MEDIHEFVEFPKLARLAREVIVTEKIDGTNACVYIGDDGTFKTASRNGWITPEQDNFGFSRWAHENKDALLQLGPGRHFGEWWGAGIQRRYGLSEKRFSLFNTERWRVENVPLCCHIVPVLYRGVLDTVAIDECLEGLQQNGSMAARGFMKPEGVVVYHVAGRVGFKKTIEKDDVPKSVSGLS